MHELTTKLDARRLELGLKQSQLCIKAGVREETYSRYLTKGRKPGKDIVPKLCEVLRLDPDTLEPLPPPPKSFPIEKLEDWLFHAYAEQAKGVPPLSVGSEDYHAGRADSYRVVIEVIHDMQKGGTQ